MSQRRLISSLAVATALALSACGSDDDSPTADSAVPLPSSTIASTEPTTSTEPTSTEPMPTIPAEPTAPSTTPSTSPAPPTTDRTEESTVPTDSTPVEIAVADLAERLDVDPTEIEVVSVEEVTWPDGGLGCPEPGMAYTQALVNGSRIVLSVDDTEYEYHSGQSGTPFYCPADRVTPPAAGGSGDL